MSPEGPQDLRASDFLQHLQRVRAGQRGEPEDGIVEGLGEDPPEAKHDARAELHISCQPAHQLPFSPDHLLHQQPLASRNAQEAPAFFPDF